MTAVRISRWSRFFVTAGAVSFVLWQLALLAGLPRRVGVVLGLYGFVLHVVFGKAYSLVPTYFDRTLRFSLAPAIHFPLTVTGTVCLAVAAIPETHPLFAPVGGVLWAAGVAVFLGTIGSTIRDNPTGRETATGEANADRRGVDRVANLFVPIALAYLAVGTYGTLALSTPLPVLVDGYPPRVTHLLAAGSVALLVFAIGFRLLPRFLVAAPPRPLVVLVLGTGAVGPALLAVSLPNGPWFRVGAVAEATAVVGFAVAYLVLFARSDRSRIGFYGVLAGVVAGIAGVGLGLRFAIGGTASALVAVHLRLNVAGFLGLTIVGITYQFYPPAVGTVPGVGDRTALASIGFVSAGLALEAVGLLTGTGLTLLGRSSVGVGACLFAGIVVALFYERHWQPTLQTLLSSGER
ncbi:hypothetical protein [Haloarcula laminariae]|uniref:hypothetical protein n=1 Tax=Haloarcula laminariae TaxID=2961577 RepID=UPI0024E092A6|nr:hypothetical protein [Halomicroarcula laminariae]